MLPTKALCITLDRTDPNRYLRTVDTLKTLGYTDASIIPIDGVVGTKLPDETLKNITTSTAYYRLKHGRTDHSQIDTVGAVGCALSHAHAWRYCADSGEPVLIAEDDIVTDHTRDDFQKILQDAPQPHDILRLSRHSPWMYDTKEKTAAKSTDWSKGAIVMSAQLYVMTPGAARILLKDLIPIDTHVDQYMSMAAEKYNLNEYAYRRPVGFTGENDTSTIGHKSVLQHPDPTQKLYVSYRTAFYIIAASALIVVFFAQILT